MPISEDYVRGALRHVTRYDEIRVRFPTRKTIYEDALHRDNCRNYEEWLADFARMAIAVLPYLQITGLALHRPGFATVCCPNTDRKPQIPWVVTNNAADFSLQDLELLPDEEYEQLLASRHF